MSDARQEIDLREISLSIHDMQRDIKRILMLCEPLEQLSEDQRQLVPDMMAQFEASQTSKWRTFAPLAWSAAIGSFFGSIAPLIATHIH